VRGTPWGDRLDAGELAARTYASGCTIARLLAELEDGAGFTFPLLSRYGLRRDVLAAAHDVLLEPA
jgi:hypothetical protein